MIEEKKELKGKTLKITQEILDKVNAIQGEFSLQGLQVNDMVEHLTTLYEIEKTKQDVPAIALELESLQSLTQRIFSTYLNLGRNIDTAIKLKEEDCVKKVGELDAEICSLKSDLAVKEGDYEALTEAFNNLAEDKNQVDELVKQQSETLQERKERIDELKEKIIILTGQQEKYESVLKENLELEEALQNKSAELMRANITVEDRNSEIERLKETNKSKNEAILSTHNDEIKTLKSNSEIDKRNALLEAGEKHQTVIIEIREKLNSRMEALTDKYNTARDNDRQEIERLNRENRELQGQIRELKNTIAVQKQDISE